MVKKRIVLKLKKKYDQFNLVLPKALFGLRVNWAEIWENLSIEGDFQELESVINKFYYSDKFNVFHKSFGIKSKNLYDLSLTSVNKIADCELIVDEYGFGFSCYDLRKISENACHPYNKIIPMNQTRIFDGTVTVLSYYKLYMCGNMGKRFSSSSLSNLSNLSFEYEGDDEDRLVMSFENAINHDFFTSNLVTIYKEKPEHLDYTVGLGFYVLSVIDDYRERYQDLLKDSYVRSTNRYTAFLKNYISFLKDIKVGNNQEKYQYVCIIIFKILQYRYNVISDAEELYSLIKDEFPPGDLNEMYWSMMLDRPNYYYYKITEKIKLININIDNIFSNCEFGEYYYTLMFFLHRKYLEFETDVNGQMHPLLNHYKTPDNYSYHDLIKYFMDAYHHIKDSDTAGKFRLFVGMLRRYYLQSTPICITRDGIIFD